MGVSARAGERAGLAQRSLGNGVHFVWLRVNILEHCIIRFIVLFSRRGRFVGSPDHKDVYMQSMVGQNGLLYWKVRVTSGDLKEAVLQLDLVLKIWTFPCLITLITFS